jgi:hypothetical protein
MNLNGEMKRQRRATLPPHSNSSTLPVLRSGICLPRRAAGALAQTEIHPLLGPYASFQAAHARGRSDAGIVGQLLQHKISNIGARNFDRPKITSDARTVTITAARVSIRQNARSLAAISPSCRNLSHM